MAVNKVLFIGRATDDARDLSSSTGKKIAEFTIAINRRFDKEKADFHRIKVFDKTAEFALKYVKKGEAYAVEGVVRSDNYTNKDGKQVYGYSVIGERVGFEYSCNINDMTITGNVVAEPEVRYTTGEKPMAVIRYRIAVGHGKDKDGKELTDFFNITTFSRSAEFFEKNVKKGTHLFVNGEWQNSSWEDKDGNKCYASGLISNRVELCFRKDKDEDPAGAPVPMLEVPTVSANDFMNIPDSIMEELPFK